MGEERVEILLKAESPAVGEAVETMSCFKKGEDLVIAFNAAYLLEAIRVLKTDNLLIKLNEPLSPALITPEKDKSFLHILMPVRTE